MKMKKLKLTDVTLTPMDFDCPVCLVKAGHKCTVPTDNSHREVNWFHSAREANLYVVAEAAHIEVIEE